MIQLMVISYDNKGSLIRKDLDFVKHFGVRILRSLRPPRVNSYILYIYSIYEFTMAFHLQIPFRLLQSVEKMDQQTYSLGGHLKLAKEEIAEVKDMVTPLNDFIQSIQNIKRKYTTWCFTFDEAIMTDLSLDSA